MEHPKRTNPDTCRHNIIRARIITEKLELFVECLSCDTDLSKLESRIGKNYVYDRYSGVWVHTPKQRGNNKVEKIQTPREEFQSHFECCTDEKWEWLKGFCLRNPVTGGLDEIEFDYNEYSTRDENGDWWIIGLPGGPRRVERTSSSTDTNK